MKFMRLISQMTLWLAAAVLPSASHAAQWPMKQGDAANTGRANFAVPANRMNGSFFNALKWQKRSPGSPTEGNLGASGMVFFDGAGPAGRDLVVGGYHWPKGVQGMDRQTGKVFWKGNPDGGEAIGEITAAFSPDGATIYVVNDATAHPMMAFSSAVGPSVYWHNGADTQPDLLGAFSPKVSADGRIFTHSWNDRPYGATDSGAAISLSWSAASSLCECLSDPALVSGPAGPSIIACGRCGTVKAFDGATGAELWSAPSGIFTDADPTADPATGNIYVPAGSDNLWVVGLDQSGNPLWDSLAKQVFMWQSGLNNPQVARSAGCLSHDAATFYFQSTSEQGDGGLYAIHTADGSLKWFFNTGSKATESRCSSPIVTSNAVIIVGNNDGGAYFALRDDESNATLLATLTTTNGTAHSSASLAPDGLLYLPARLVWTQGNGDGDAPTQQPENLFNAFDLNAVPEIVLAPPSSQQGRPLNSAVALSWLAVADTSGQFAHYAIYRNSQPFSSVAGLTPLATITNRTTTQFVDGTALNGLAYYYAITSVTISGKETTDIQSIGPFVPYDETDLQIVCISRTPRFPRYAPIYTGYTVTEPSGFGPYTFTAATGLSNGQTTNTARWPQLGAPVTYTATVRNRGSNPWPGPVRGIWRWDGSLVEQPSSSATLNPDDLVTFTLVHPWDSQSHEITFSLADPDARTNNNSLTIDSKAVPYLTYIDASYYQQFRTHTSEYRNAATDDLIDWLNRHLARFNEMFATSSCAKRVHYDVLEILPDSAPDPAIDRQPFAIFPFRYHASDGDARLSGYYHADEDIDYGLLHEMGHQLGLIDLYQLDVAPEANLVSGLGYSGLPDLMHGVSPVLSDHTALVMNHWLNYAHGYYGQFLYGIPAQVRMRFVGFHGEPLSGASVKMYQLCSRPDLGKVISTQIKAEGLTDTNGEFVLPNVPIDHSKVPPLPTGDALADNPFGYVAVVGDNGVLHFRIEYQGGVDYAWLDITEPNVAFYRGQTNLAVFERQVSLGGPVEQYPPLDLAEANAASWTGWAQGSSPGNTFVLDDTQRKQVGSSSIKFVTDGGFDTYVRYPGVGMARWNLAQAQFLNFRTYAVNTNIGFQNGSPWVRLKDGAGNYFQYQFYEGGNPSDILNTARNTWCSFQIPLTAPDSVTDGWRRTAFGTPDLSQIQFLEFHADTWGYGFTVWLDGVSFAPPLRPAITFSFQGSSLILTWPNATGFALEAATDVLGPYTPVAEVPIQGSFETSLTLPLSAQQQYFRLHGR